MLIELWERLRGYDRWIETTARFEAADVKKSVHVDSWGRRKAHYATSDTIAWTDQQGNIHRDSFRVSDSSSLYLMVDGEQVDIRYNPARPNRYYYRALFVSRLRAAAGAILMVLLLAGLLFLKHWHTY